MLGVERVCAGSREQAESKEGCCPFNNQFLNKECQSPWYAKPLSFPPNPSLVGGGETDTKAIMAQIKYLESCQSAVGVGKSFGVVNKA